MTSRVRFSALPWGFFHEREDAHGDIQKLIYLFEIIKASHFFLPIIMILLILLLLLTAVELSLGGSRITEMNGSLVEC
jgi:hypothetical protein